jgi:hypothetical protein
MIRLYLTWRNRNTYDCRLSNRQHGKRCLIRHWWSLFEVR